MKDFFTWMESSQGFEHGWLILGKGPSFDLKADFALDEYKTIGLNHVVRELRVDVAHFIDIEVVEHCSEHILENAEIVLMPWVPHVRAIKRGRVHFQPGEKTLVEYFDQFPLLRELDHQGRLIWYNLVTAPAELVREGSPLVNVRDFSATAALNLLADSGVKVIRSLGVDGGSAYNACFEDLAGKTKLQTGQKSYDTQFQEFARVIMKYDLDFKPLHLDGPIKVYVGTQVEQMLAFKVLEYSIKKHSSMSVEVIPLFEAVEEAGIKIPMPSDPSIRPKTPFSFQRFAIPSLNGYEGRAIYVDSDMQVFQDIAELWNSSFDGHDLLTVYEDPSSGRRPQFSVMLLDCQSLAWDVEDIVNAMISGKRSYEETMYKMSPANSVGATLPQKWNDLERYSDSTTALTHYTDMERQPWIDSSHKLGKVWCEDLFSAIEGGFIERDFVENEVDRGWVRPSILYQIDNEIVDPLLLPVSVVKRDFNTFIPPYKMAGSLKKATGYGQKPSSINMSVRKAYAVTRHVWNVSGAKKLAKKLHESVLE